MTTAISTSELETYMTDTTTMKPRGASPQEAVPGPNTAQAVAVREERPSASQVESPRAVAPEPSRLVVIDQPVGEIAGAIAEVMANVGVVQKSGENTFHNYKYAKMEDLLQAITPLMGKAGLAVIQNEITRAIVADSRVTVTYEFTILHKSGQYWPERPRFTGMCNAKTKKGDLDDKAINKCHTAARKYFLLSLFQVPTGDIDDSDDEQQPQQRAPQQRASRDHGPVPGPGQQQKPPAQDTNKPHKIVLGEGTGAQNWANAYIKALGTAKTLDELKAWDAANDGPLDGVSKRYPDIYTLICQAYELREAGLNGATAAQSVDPQTGEVLDTLAPGPGPDDEIIIDEMPDPAKDATGAVNWIAQRLTDIQKPDEAIEFWSETVQPRLGEFSEPDIAVIEGELRRANARLAGQKVR